MVVGEIPEAVDLLVVGAGPGGYVAAINAAHMGRSVLLVERAGPAGLGGACLHDACIPSKALLEVAELVSRAGELSHAGVTARTSFDMPQWQAWRNKLVGRLQHGVESLLVAAGVTVLEGTLRFTRRRQAVVEVPEGTARYFEFRDAIIATGARPRQLPELPSDGVHVLDSAQALRLEVMPERLLVVGAGRTGVELATTFVKLGAQVTLCEQAERILPSYDRELGPLVQSRLGQLGVEVLTQTEVKSRDGDRIRVVRAGQDSTVEGGLVLVATGRRPNTDDLGLERLGVKADERGFLDVAADQRVTEHAAAIGDCTAGPALAHRASAEAAVAVAALTRAEVAFPPGVVPDVVYSDPEVATAGITVAEAEAQGMDVRTTTFPLSALGRATIRSRGNRGFARMITRTDDDVIVGVQMVGPHASELIGTGVLAIEMRAEMRDLADCVQPHPTFTEAYRELAGVGVGSPIHVPLPS